MKLMVVSMVSWNTLVGSDTWPKLLKNYNPNDIANISFRDEYPDNNACSNYFVISERKIIKSVFKRHIKTGYRVDSKEYIEDNICNTEFYNQLYKNRQKNVYIKRMIREIIWKFGKWKSNELNRFIDDFNPDVVLYFMDGYIYFNKICRYITKRTGAKSIGFFVDDTFTYKQSGKIGFKILRYFQRKSLHKLVSDTDAFWAITHMTKKEADKEFGIDCKIVTKPISDEVNYKKREIKFPVRMLYTGKLIIGRDRSLKKLCEALKNINKDSIKFYIDVYTNTPISEKLSSELQYSYLNIHTAVEQKYIADLQQNADILLFLEDVDGDDALTARLSFSTKIVDYLSASRCILAVGNMETAPMQYFKENNAALLAQSTYDIEKTLKMVAEDLDIVEEMAYNAYLCGQKNHSEGKVLEVVDGSIKSLLC
ncbi:MAG: hypothetical protein K5768_10560 [Firmicutes bacterium]|nr:hypothetical protein [Bacillota bacterium]